MQAVCRALCRAARESPRTAMGGGGERFKVAPTVRVLQADGESLRGSASLNFPPRDHTHLTQVQCLLPASPKCSGFPVGYPPPPQPPR